MKIPFNKPYLTGKEIEYIQESLKSGNIVGNCEFTKKCERLMEEKFGAKKVLLTSSCTSAMEMASLLIDLQPDDEVIVPSFTFVSTANAFILRGAKPVFVDIRADTLNIDEEKIEEKITRKTKAIYPVHYAGVSCEMDAIINIAEKYNLYVMEDSAQGVNAKYKNKFLGTIGHFGAYSFHGTKNYTCGEGGALIINDEKFIERAEILREKGTNRSKFIRGEVDKYTWVDIGSSFLLSDVSASFLYAQLECLEEIKEKRRAVFNFYYENLKELEDSGFLKLPIIPQECETNYHIFYVILPTHEKRNSLLDKLKLDGIQATFHYIPLHNSPMGMKFGYKNGDLPITETISDCILRLPFYADLKLDELSFIVKKIKENVRCL